MGEALDQILEQTTGASFFRADLHVHSLGPSHDVRDPTMTPQNIVRTAIDEGLAMVAITDHNEISNVEAALKAARGKPLTVIPGIELSTPQGHLLLYLPTLEALQKLHGKLSIVERGTPTSRCQESLFECLNLVNALGGFGISLSDLKVSLKYSENAYSPEASTQIIEAMGWRTNQQPRATWLVEQLTIPRLLEAIQKSDTKPITAIKTKEGVQVFSETEAKSVLERLGRPPVKFALERAKLHDLPRLTVSREVANDDGQKRFVVRDFSKLSLGQQQSVLLALILSSDSNRPLIIDQPEDNLDGEFIYSTLVPVLRRAKERRQVIIVTHNANVAVLGDAEQIIVMKALNDKGEIVSRGSIDDAETRDLACSILEGAREAFTRRAKMYGMKTE